MDNESRKVGLESIVAELAAFDRLQDGWLDGEGVGLADRDRSWIPEVLRRSADDPTRGVPGIYPTPDGNIQAEWIDEEQELDVTAVFDLDQRTIRLELLHLDTGEAVEDRKFAPQQTDAILSSIAAARRGGAA
ncbi:MAG: hypothetical protein ACO3UM_08675 [Planctomycetota bacterium]